MNRWRLVGMLLWLAPTVLLAQDQVIPLSGTPASGTVVESSPTEVVVEARNGKRRIPVNEIRRVSFREDPAELRRARDRILVGDLEAALADLKKIDATRIERAEVQQDLQYYLAYCQGRLALSAGGEKSVASTMMLDFAKEHPRSYHFFESAELLGDLAVASEQYDDAVRYYRAIAAKAPWPEFRMRAVIREARAQLDKQDLPAAEKLFKSAEEFEVDTPDARRQKRFAAIGRAICLTESGSLDEGRSLIEKIIADNDPQDTELFGRAYNALGRYHLRADQPKDALLAYLHVDVLFYSEPDVHAESLFNLSNLWKSVDRADRAQAARNLLADRYSGSKWSQILE